MKIPPSDRRADPCAARPAGRARVTARRPTPGGSCFAAWARGATRARGSARARVAARGLRLVAGLAAALAASAALACGFHEARALGLGMLNLAYPDSLHVRTAVWTAQRDGLLARVDPTPAPDEATARLIAMQGYRRALASLDGLRNQLDGARDGHPAPPFAVVLISSLLWTRYEPSAAGLRMTPHVDGPAPDEVVVVTDGPVIDALRDGRLTGAAARERGLVRIYGAADRSALVDALIARLGAPAGPRVAAAAAESFPRRARQADTL
jgi:hypothetical protein